MADKDFVVKNGIVTGSNSATFGNSVYFASNGNIGFGNSVPTDKVSIYGSFSSGNNNINGWVNSSSGYYGTVQTANQSSIDHNSLSNFSSNKHIDHTAVSISSGNGLTGGGDISSTRTLSVVSGTGTVVNATGVHVNSTYIGTISSNNTTYVNGKTEGNLNVNSATYATSAGSATNASAATNATYATSAGSATNATTATYVAGGSSGQILKSNGSTSVWGSGITSGSVATTTSGTTVPFTGIPSWAKRITFMLYRVSINSTDAVLLRLGTSSGYASSGYYGHWVSSIVGQGLAGANISTEFNIYGYWCSDGYYYNGSGTITNLTSNIWCLNSLIGNDSASVTCEAAGSVSLPSTLTSIQFFTSAGNSFDNGYINIFYE